MSKGPIKLDSFPLRPINRGQPQSSGAENTRPAGIESLLGEVAHYYEEQLTMLNKELASARASAAQYQFQPQASQTREINELQAALNSADRERITLRTQLDQAEEKIDSLANLYLAAYTLHRRHDWSHVMRGLTDVLVNQIGADSFAVFLRDREGKLEAILSQLPPDGAPAGDELTASLGRTEIDYDLDGVVADVPLVNSDQVIGCIHIYRLLSQKRSLNDADKKLLSAISALVATAISASITTRKAIEPKNEKVGSVTGPSAIDQPVVPEVNHIPHVFTPNIQVTGDMAADLSEMPPALLDYSTLLNTAPEPFTQAESPVISAEPKIVRNGNQNSGADSDSSRFRALSAGSSGSSGYPPGEDYLKFVGKDATIPGEPGESQTAEESGAPSDKAKRTSNRESGLLFRQSPIKRA